MSWLDDAASFFEHPIDQTSALVDSIGPSITSAANSLAENLGFAVHVDTPAQAAVRANGIDPSTGQLIAPQYAFPLRLKGVVPTDPNSMAKYIAQTEADANNFINDQTAKNAADLNKSGDAAVGLAPEGTSTPSAFIVLAVIALILYIAFQVV